MRRIKTIGTLLFLVVFDVFVWGWIFFVSPNSNPEFYFLDIGQGDAELVILPGGVKILIDGGPDNRVLQELSSVLRSTDRYIDLVLMSHPQADHYNGLVDVLRRYSVGAFISSGKKGQAKSFTELEKAINQNKIAAVALGEGGRISYGENSFAILSPSPDLLSSAEPNDWSLVLKLETGGVKTLFTGDIGSKVEERLLKKYDLDIDILKVAHHGSKFSSSEAFLKAATPAVALIGVGKNSYGHPTSEALARLKSLGTQIFRADQDGTIKLKIRDEKISIFKQK